MQAVLSLGSNAGNSIRYLEFARNALHDNGIVMKKASSLYTTEPQGNKETPWYYNQVILTECYDTPEILLEKTQSIEKALGRLRIEGFSCEPRTIDIDILLYGTQTVNTSDLSIPHPRMNLRAFVLVPLQEIAPSLILYDGKTAGDFLKNIEYRLENNIIWQ